METVTFRPKRDRRTRPRIVPNIGDRAFERDQRGDGRGQDLNDRLGLGLVMTTEAVQTPVEGDADVTSPQAPG
jgi:hypothetical protein